MFMLYNEDSRSDFILGDSWEDRKMWSVIKICGEYKIFFKNSVKDILSLILLKHSTRFEHAYTMVLDTLWAALEVFCWVLRKCEHSCQVAFNGNADSYQFMAYPYPGYQAPSNLWRPFFFPEHNSVENFEKSCFKIFFHFISSITKTQNLQSHELLMYFIITIFWIKSMFV